MRLVILQPFYLPYSGVFELVRLADTFVFYDDVQFVSQNWMSRNTIKGPSGPQWLTVPVHGSVQLKLNDVHIAHNQPWRRKHARSIRAAYGRAPHFSMLDELLQVYEEEWEYLVDLDLATFEILRRSLGVDAEFLRSSELGVPGRSSERVLDHCIELGATHYLSGPSARSYLDEQAFESAGIILEYFEFDHPVYPQMYGEFVPFMSAIDLIANMGAEAPGLLAGSGRPVPAGEPPTR